MNSARLSGSSLRLSSSLLKALYNNLEAYHIFLSYISIGGLSYIIILVCNWNRFGFIGWLSLVLLQKGFKANTEKGYIKDGRGYE